MHSRACPERGSCSRSRPRSDPLAPRGNTGSADHVLPLLRDSERRAACEAATRVANALRTNAFYRRGDPYTCREPDLLRLASDLTRRWRRCSLKRALLPDRRLRAVTPSCASRKIRGRCPQALRPDDDPGLEEFPAALAALRAQLPAGDDAAGQIGASAGLRCHERPCRDRRSGQRG
jgi:hypothetical protein